MTRLQQPFRSPVVRKLIAPFILLDAYLGILSSILPEGVNRVFVREFLFICSICTIIALTAWLVVSLLHHLVEPIDSESGDRLRAADAILVLLPLSPIVGYVLRNLDTLRWHDALAVVCIFALVSAAVVVVVPQCLSRWLSPSVAALLGLSLAFVLATMSSVTRGFRWHGSGELLIQVAFFSLVFTACLFVYRKDRGALRSAVVFYLLGTVAVAAASELTSEMRRPSAVERPGVPSVDVLAASREIKRTPDIFLMTYDSYVENETMLQYGIDNSDQEAFLESAGFQIYRGTYSIAGATMASMGRVLGPTTAPRRAASGHSAMFDVLKHAGYRTHGVFQGSGYFWGQDNGYDEGFPPSRPAYLATSQAILEGEFRHEIHFQEMPMDRFLQRKRSVIAAEGEDPTFLYTHTGPGHSQNSGACLDDEVARFRQRLDDANAEMRVDIESLVKSRPNAIVIVNGDHGPYLTKNCRALRSREYDQDDVAPLDIQDRFGAFLAIRWPEDAQISVDDIAILQDIFPAVLTYLYDDSTFQRLRFPQELEGSNYIIAGVSVRRGRIVGGKYNGQPLFDAGRASAR